MLAKPAPILWIARRRSPQPVICGRVSLHVGAGNCQREAGSQLTAQGCGYNFRTVSSALRARIKHFLKRVIVIGLSSVLGVTGLAYAVDYFVFRYRVAGNREPFGQVTVTSYDAVAQKSGKTQFIFNPPEAQTCVHALFPHEGYTPCWYLQQHTEQRTDI